MRRRWHREATAIASGARRAIIEPCCAAELAGRWCSSCGQSDDARHRSINHLGAEFAEALTLADRRLWRTLGRLTRDDLEGHRISQLPPLRLALIALFLLFAVASLLTHLMHVPRIPTSHLAELQNEISESVGDLKEARSEMNRSAHARNVDQWIRARVTHAVADPAGFVRFIAEWAERFAI